MTAAELVRGASESLDAIRANIDALVEARDNLMLTARAELAAAGISAYVVRPSGARWREHVGQVGSIVTRYTHGAHQSFVEDSFSPRRDIGYVGPWASRDLFIDRGPHEVLLIDDDQMLVAALPDSYDAETAHKKSVVRLRRLAKSEHMRVRVRDREATLISPMNDVVHIGDVESAFKWLLGFSDVKLVDR